jgi:hypothetical protein
MVGDEAELFQHYQFFVYYVVSQTRAGYLELIGVEVECSNPLKIPSQGKFTVSPSYAFEWVQVADRDLRLLFRK